MTIKGNYEGTRETDQRWQSWEIASSHFVNKFYKYPKIPSFQCELCATLQLLSKLNRMNEIRSLGNIWSTDERDHKLSKVARRILFLVVSFLSNQTDAYSHFVYWKYCVVRVDMTIDMKINSSVVSILSIDNLKSYR